MPSATTSQVQSTPQSAITPQAQSTLQAEQPGSMPQAAVAGSAWQHNLQSGNQPKPAQSEADREAFWRTTIQQQRQAGLNIREFCRQRKLSESAFHYWKREIALRDGQPVNATANKKTASTQKKNPAPTFIPITLDPVRRDSSRIEQPQVEQPQVEIRYPGGTTVRIASGCDESTISIILKAIGQGTC